MDNRSYDKKHAGIETFFAMLWDALHVFYTLDNGPLLLVAIPLALQPVAVSIRADIVV